MNDLKRLWWVPLTALYCHTNQLLADSQYAFLDNALKNNISYVLPASKPGTRMLSSLKFSYRYEAGISLVTQHKGDSYKPYDNNYISCLDLNLISPELALNPSLAIGLNLGLRVWDRNNLVPAQRIVQISNIRPIIGNNKKVVPWISFSFYQLVNKKNGLQLDISCIVEDVDNGVCRLGVSGGYYYQVDDIVRLGVGIKYSWGSALTPETHYLRSVSIYLNLDTKYYKFF